MDNVKVILKKFNEALEVNDMLTMMESVLEMKELDPTFVDLMMNCIPDDDDEEEDDE